MATETVLAENSPSLEKPTLTFNKIYNVFLSSTSVDLQEYRIALKNHLTTTLKQVAIEMNDFGAIPKDAVTACEDKVARCDFFIGIYAFRYGHIPEGEQSSITEIEYDKARSLGKRCLCFFADELLRSELTPDNESDFKKERLLLFKEKIEKQVVRAMFTSLGNLKDQITTSFNQFLAGEPIGFHLKDVVSRWQQWQSNKHSLYVETKLLKRQGTVTSPLFEHWQQFRNTEPWHEMIMVRLKEVETFSNQLELGEIVSVVNALKQVCKEKSYHFIVDEIIKIVPVASACLAQTPRNIVHGNAKHSENDRKYYLDKLAHHLKKLWDEAQSPHYQKAFLIMGSIGAGKTHFISSLLKEACNCELILPLEYNDEKLEALILAGIIEATGNMQWRSLEEFHHLIDRSSVHLVVAVDGLHEWQRRSGNGYESRLIKFIANHSRLHEISWVITVKDTAYDTAITQMELWNKYGYHPYIKPDKELRSVLDKRQIDMDGWLMLDHLNHAKKTGLKMIKEELNQDDYEFLYSHFENVPASKSIQDQLSAPFFATLFIDLHYKVHDPGFLANLHHIDLVNQFWEKISKSMSPILSEKKMDQTCRREDLEDLTYMATRMMVKEMTISPLTERLVEGIATESKSLYKFANVDLTRSLLDVLIQGHMLERVRRKNTTYGPEHEYVELRFEIFWKNKLALRLLEVNETEGKLKEYAVQQIEEWFGRIDVGELKEGIVEFLLLRLDWTAVEQGKPNADIVNVWQSILDSKVLPSAAVWFAGAKSKAIPQVKFLQWADERRLYPDRHLLFSLLYYLGAAVVENDNILPRRYKLLQKYYRDIATEKLNKYFIFVFTRMFDNCTSPDAALSCMSYLSGCEVLGATNVLAEVSFSKLAEVLCFDEKSISDKIFKYLKAEGEKATYEYSLYFTEDEFYLQKKDVRRLCEAINNKVSGIERGDDSLAWLETLVKRTDLADKIINLKISWSVKVKDLESRTKQFRKFPFKSLGSREQSMIKRLNRLMIQELFPNESPRLPDSWQRLFFREWIICEYCRWLTGKMGVNAYHFLSRRNWYASKHTGIYEKISLEMEREANIALGSRYYNSSNEKEQAALYSIVEQLVMTQNAHKVEIAFHLIRHTTPTYGREPSNIDIAPIFHEMLQKIYLSNNLDRIISIYRDLFRHNLKNFDALNKERAKNNRFGKSGQRRSL